MHTFTLRCCALLLALAACASGSKLAGAQSTLRCRAADDASARLILELKNWMTTANPGRRADRDTLYRIPVVSTGQIALVTDERVCARAAAAYGPPAGSTVTPSVYTVKLGNKGFAVLDPTQLAGEYSVVLILDTKFVRIGGWTGG
jgi:hypothetical protein